MHIKEIISKSIARLSGIKETAKFQDNPWQQKQNAFMEKCFSTARVKLMDVLHVGGHLGEEYCLYKKLGAQRIAFFEPVPDYFDELSRRLGANKDVVLFKTALGAKEETKEMHLNRGSGESSSFLKPTSLYDGFFEEKTIPLLIITLDSILPTIPNFHRFNTLVTDTQGFDLQVLQGAGNTLNQIQYIYTEVSKGHYHGEPQIEDFDSFLTPFGFKRADSFMYGNWKGSDQWGDVFYIKGNGAS